jgi:carboxylesterase type B
MYILVLLLLLALWLPSTTFSKSLDEEEFETTVKVSTKLGKVQGIRQTGIDFFGGIPYAAPPVGNLRWAPPEEPVSWKPHMTLLDATHFGPDCWQVVDPLQNPLADPTQMSEDCLYLNIFTPAGLARSRSKLLPVLVWFHGGAFQQGGARRPEYDGRRLAERDMVVVTINYRLGSLGFLVSSPDGILGNFGLMDQRAALYWIQSHIQSFGGDPNKITLFGESAGAVMIGLHLLMHNPGLFHKAVMQSNPVGYRFRSVVVADFLGDALKRGVDCRDLACLRTEPVEEIMRAQSSLMGIPRSVGDFFTWGPILTNELQLTLGGGRGAGGGGGAGGDPRLRPGDSLLTNLEHRSLFRVESYQKHRESAKFAVNVSQPLINLKNVPDEIPIIIGTNLHEGEMFVHSAFPITMSKAVYWMFVGALFKDSASRVLKHYRPYVETVERQAQEIAERQIQEEEYKQYYTEHREQLEEEYEMLLALNASRNDNRPLMTPEAVESLVRTWHSGGGGGAAAAAAQDEGGNAGNAFGNLTTYNNKPSWINRIWPWESESETAREERLAMKRRLRELRRKEKQRAKALSEAAKVVVDYRPVMSRIISDYLFRCPSWHYAHSLSHNRVQRGKKNNVYVYRFSQPTHVPGYNECWGKVCLRLVKTPLGYLLRPSIMLTLQC